MRLPYYIPAVALLSLPFGMLVASFSGNKSIGLLSVIIPIVVALLIHDHSHKQPFNSIPTNQDPELESLIKKNTHVQEQVIAFSALGLGLAVTIIGSYWQHFWAILLIGLYLVVRFWSHRQSSNLKSALCFVGVFVALYGAIGTVVQLLLK